MPFVYPIATAAGSVALKRRHGDDAERAIEEALAHAFKEHTGEELPPGVKAFCGPVVVDDYMDCPLCVTVVAKWNVRRHRFFDAIEHDMEAQIQSWDPDLSAAEVHIVKDGSKNTS